MKKLILYVIILLAAFLLAACDPPKDGEDGDPAEGGWSDDTTDRPLVNIVVVRKVQKGRCLADARVQVWPLIPGTFKQTGAQFIEFTGVDGSVSIPAQVPIDTTHLFTYFKGTCEDEANGGEGIQELYSVQKISELNSNTNPLNKISYNVAKSLHEDGFGTEDECLAEAERQIIDYLSMPKISESFGDMSLEKSGPADGVLALASSMILYGRTDAEAGDFMKAIATDIINGDDSLRAGIRDVYDVLPLLGIKGRLEGSYAAVGITIDTPPFWRIFAPTYYANLWEYPHATVGEFSPGNTTGCTSDLPYKYYAIPHVFTGDWIELSQYIATNLSGDVSIWTRGIHPIDGYDMPGEQILAVEELRELLLDSTLPFHGRLGAHGLTDGLEVYFYAQSDVAWALSVGDSGGFLPFGRNLSSNDGVDWLGHDENTTCRRMSGLSLKGIN